MVEPQIVILVVAGSSPVDHPTITRWSALVICHRSSRTLRFHHTTRMESLESILGHTFRQPELLTEALTHASLAYEQQRPTKDNQRLEFLGDAVLQLVLSEALYHRMPDTDEGGLTKTRASLVSTKALAKLGRALGIGRFIEMGRGEEASGGRDRDSTLADVMESLIGAAFIDGGLPAASAIVLRLMHDMIANQHESNDEKINPKGALQELTQDVTNQLPVYQILGASGPDHDKLYEATVSWHEKLLGAGTGRSKKEAEIEAARAAIRNPLLNDLIARAKLSPSTPNNPANNCP